MLNAVKSSMRISHSKSDQDILKLIDAAFADLIRSGADERVVRNDNPLVVQAVIVYCKREFTDDVNKHNRFNLSYQQMLDEIRKSGDDYLHRSDRTG